MKKFTCRKSSSKERYKPNKCTKLANGRVIKVVDLNLNGANLLKFHLLLCLFAPRFDPPLLCIANIALGVEALFLQHTILCPTMDTNTFVFCRIERELDLRVAGQIGTHVDFR